ncbi:hypothetical protein [Comamonas fluminis]|uniref:hypothetical protein n=1 Tax=Comamonas fluminis TaxID=2796366 RepID=UPI001C459B05|nr:hypothetical protein [Comamonas fluminis]
MKRYFFEPGAVQCYRKSGIKARLIRGGQIIRGVLNACLGDAPSDSIGNFVLIAAAMCAVAACVGALAGYVQFELQGMGVIR